MALKNARSDTPGARANLRPGEVKHQRADDLLLMRGDGNRKLAIDLDRWTHDAPPADGASGAPLIRQPDGAVTWDADLAPACEVDGLISVDEPPAGYGVPGFDITGLGDATEGVSGRVWLEPFHLASDRVHLDEIALFCLSGAGTSVRVGIANGVEDIVFESRFELADGLNVIPVGLDLTHGDHTMMIWCGGAIALRTAVGLRRGQGLTFTERTPVFTRREQAAANMGTALYLQGLETTAMTSAVAGEDHALLLKWSLTT